MPLPDDDRCVQPAIGFRAFCSSRAILVNRCPPLHAPRGPSDERRHGLLVTSPNEISPQRALLLAPVVSLAGHTKSYNDAARRGVVTQLAASHQGFSGKAQAAQFVRIIFPLTVER